MDLPLLATNKFPFIWKRHFVPETESEDCVPACIAMAAKYWKLKNKSLAISTTKEDIQKFLEEMRVHSHRGTNLVMLQGALDKLKKKEGLGLKLKIFQPKHLADLTKLFELQSPLPLILCYDRARVINNIKGPNHASLLYSIDIPKEQVGIIDPAMSERISPFRYPIDDFIHGWRAVQNLTIVVYPSNIRVPINMRETQLNESITKWSTK